MRDTATHLEITRVGGGWPLDLRCTDQGVVWGNRDEAIVAGFSIGAEMPYNFR